MELHVNNKEQKIYSRPRIKLKRNNRKKHRNNSNNKLTKSAFKISVIILLLFIITKYFFGVIYPMLNEASENKAKSISTIISNEKASEVMKNYTYEELFNIEKDAQGNVVMIKANSIKINEIASNITTRIQNEMNLRKKEKLEISLGNFLGLKMLAGRGPKIKIYVSSVENVDTNLKSEFVNKGINQTLHRLFLEVKCTARILEPFQNESKQITSQILLMENIIIGNVPDTFYNIEGLNENNDVMEVIQ